MTASPAPSIDFTAATLEQNELIAVPECPFSLPDADAVAFLLLQQMTAGRRKDISFDPASRRLSGVPADSGLARERLVDVLTGFSESVTEWVKATLPTYAEGLVRDRVTLRPEEEANRALRLTARNDLLHIDNFPTRPTFGRRILRVFTNINMTESQVWATSEKFPQLLARFVANKRVPSRTKDEWLSTAQGMLSLIRGARTTRSHYDAFMMKLHHFLKQNTAFQTSAARKVCTFPPGTTWALFSDGLANAQLRGCFALEHSFFVPMECLVRPEDAPLSVLRAH